MYNPGPAYTVPDAAAYLACSPRFVQREVAAGRLGHYRMGRLLRIAQADLDAYIAACRNPDSVA